MDSKQEKLETLNIDKPRYDQRTYLGRCKHFVMVTNPLNVLVTDATLKRAKEVITAFKKGELTEPISVDELWRHKYIYDSAFHPDTGEKQIVFGRMSAQVPMNMLITAGMMTFYKTSLAVFGWQWFNQTFNAVVNYTNRSGDSPISVKQLGISYVLATAGAVGTGISFNSFAQKLPPIIGRFVPFFSVCVANCINIPCMRIKEITDGTPIFDAEEHRLANSTAAGRSGIAQVVLSRIIMAAPGMLTIPFAMQHFENSGFFKRKPWAPLPLQLLMVGTVLIITTPLSCAIFKQNAEISFRKLDRAAQAEVRKNISINDDEIPRKFYYNKGL